MVSSRVYQRRHALPPLMPGLPARRAAVDVRSVSVGCRPGFASGAGRGGGHRRMRCPASAPRQLSTIGRVSAGFAEPVRR